MFIAGIICLIIGLVFIICSFVLSKNTHKINKNIDEQNEKLKKENEELNHHNKYLLTEFKELTNKQDKINEIINIKQNEINEKERQLNQAQKQIDIKQKELSNFQDNITKAVENQKQLSQQAYENYCDILQDKYNIEEEEYEAHIKILKETYENLQLEYIEKADAARESLAQIEATRAAAIQAQIKEKEISDNSSFYCLQISDNDLKDIAVLEAVKPKLNNQRILSMLIWQTYFRTPMTNLCNNIIGKESKTGIYKITNQLTKECYVGQASDLASRWKEHAKCGLDIDTPAGNKLYKAMIEYGIQNFSWEVLEYCKKEELNDKEKYYIKLYQAKEYGYNSNAGIGKK